MVVIKKGNKYLKTNLDAKMKELPYKDWVYVERKDLAMRVETEEAARAIIKDHPLTIKQTK